MGFAQHQSFYFRDKWLEKALDSFFSTKDNLIITDSSLFGNSDNFSKIGLGKNMFESLKYWIVAFELATKKNGDFTLTTLGEKIKNLDPVARHNDTLSILHYNLSKNLEIATAWYWFYNINNRINLSKEEILDETSLFGWSKSNYKKVSESSIKKDILCLIQMYTQKPDPEDPEDTLFSPFYRLKLITNKEHSIVKNIPNIEDIGLGALSYCINDYCIKNQVRSLTIEDIITKEGLWGKIFNLNKIKSVDAINQIINKKLLKLNFSRTADLDTIILEHSNQEELLDKIYGELEKWK